MTLPEPRESLPDLILAEASDLGMKLRRESSTRTVWPIEYVALRDGSKPPTRSADLSVTGATDGSDGLAILAQLAAAMSPQPTPADPLAVSRALAEAAQLGAWLSPTELARLLWMAAATGPSWRSGHRPRPDFEMERRKDCASTWWRVLPEGEV